MQLSTIETITVSIKDELIMLAASLNILNLWKEFSKGLEDSKYNSKLKKNNLIIEYDESIHGSSHYVKCNEYKITEKQYLDLKFLINIRQYLIDGNAQPVELFKYNGEDITIKESN